MAHSPTHTLTHDQTATTTSPHNSPPYLPAINPNEIRLEEGDPSLLAAELEMDIDGISNDRVDLDELRRVKVYELVENKWTDRGTALCISKFDKDTEQAQLIAQSEDNPEDTILSFYIRGEDVYQRQQGTLIVWTESDGTDFALSFQDVEGCNDVWEFIESVQRSINGGSNQGGHHENDEQFSSSPPPDSGSITFESIVQESQLPTPQFGIMEHVERAIKYVGRNATLKDKLVEHIINTEYVRQMIDLALQAEDLEQLHDLHALYSCLQAILLLNDHTIFDHVTSDELFLGTCGILEYDPEFPNHKASYRDFLAHQAQFRQPVPFTDESVRKKIHQTYRLQYLKDVVLARAMEDSTFNVLNSCIIFNQIDLINHVQHDSTFMKDLVGLFDLSSRDKGKAKEPNGTPTSSDAEPKPNGESSSDHPNGIALDFPADADERRRHVILLIQQLCGMGKNIQLTTRLQLFRSLVEQGIVTPLQWALSQDRLMICTAGEILGVLLDHDTGGVRQHILNQVAKDPDGPTLLTALSSLLISHPDSAVKSLIADSLKSLLEIPLDQSEHVANIKSAVRQREDPTAEKFLDYAYTKGVIRSLIKPLSDIPEYKSLAEPKLSLSNEMSSVYFHLCELFCAFMLQHGFRSNHLLLDTVVAPRIASLLTTRDKHLRLVALRFLRLCLKQNNRNLSNHIMKHDIMVPILDLTAREAKRDNLLSSSCQEIFENMRRDNSKDLIHHIMTRHETKIRALADQPIVGPRFQAFIRRWEQNVEPPPTVEGDQKSSDASTSKKWGQGRGMEAEEEEWFNDSDEEEPPSPLWQNAQTQSPLVGKRKRLPKGGSSTTSNGRRNTALKLTGNKTAPLVDYDEDEENVSPTSPSIETARISLTLRNRTPAPIRLPTLEGEPDKSQARLTRSNSPEGSAEELKIPRLGEKRRREEDDDEMFERLAHKGKRQSLAGESDSDDPKPAMSGEEGTKKFKLKIASIALNSVGSDSTAGSEPGVKDGDGG
ncbi:DUF625-domain-containing protein [Sistotremastrum niveocremeum HHB9708]|uniref:DUF625-domain-containing protein n=1 Tax=Sistotremastrum niveocremeum HHB9708 TaxID=1314777 RepID=A0A164ZLF8_9AGAM|nr:DUF625-domain-containing protein [Sistotremastrum niveocremeum HHB9708]